MREISFYLRDDGYGTLVVDSNNVVDLGGSVPVIVRNQPVVLNICLFADSVSSHPMGYSDIFSIADVWVLNIAPRATLSYGVCLQGNSVSVLGDGTISVLISETDTVEAAKQIGRLAKGIWTAELSGLKSGELVPSVVYQFKVGYLNRVANENASPPESEVSLFYTKAQVNSILADMGAAVPHASELQYGTVQLASMSDLEVGTDSEKAVVSSALKSELDRRISGIAIPDISGKVDKVEGKDLSTNDFTDAYKTKVNADVESVSALPTPVVGILNRAYFLTADDGTKKAGTIWKCVADGESYVMQQIQTDLSTLTDTTGLFAAKENTANKAVDFSTVNNIKFPTTQAVKDFAQNETLTELTGTEVSVAPWTQSKWSASGVCTLTATGWASGGTQTSEILITLAAGSTPSVIGAAVSDNDVLSAAGVYSCFIRNEDGVVRFKIAGFTEET